MNIQRFAFAFILTAATHGLAVAAGIFDGDLLNSTTNQPYPILPGVPLITGGIGDRYRPPVVDLTHVGDVDLVVRSATLGIGPTMPPPQAVPPVVIAGGTHVVTGGTVPFTVIASTGGSGIGVPLSGTSLDLTPVIVTAWADLDGDGIVGPTDADAQGATDNTRELQEALYPVGQQIAVFVGGVATGSVAIWSGAPASAGGLTVVLTAMAYIGMLNPHGLFPFIPEGPPVATLLPFFPDFNVDHVIDGKGDTAANPSERLKIALDPAFDIPVNDPDLPGLGTPFAIPTNGSSLTVDRAVINSSAVSRLRFVRPSIAPGFPINVVIPLYRGAGGNLFEALTQTSLTDNGAGGGVHVRVVPVDLLDNITDPTTPFTATLVAGPGLAITSPNSDNDPSRETVSITTAVGLDLVLDDAGGVNDSGTASTLAVTSGGFPNDVIAVQITPRTGGGVVPTILGAEIIGQPTALSHSCGGTQTIVAVIDSTQAVTASANLSVNGAAVATVSLPAAARPADTTLPLGQAYVGQFDPTTLPLGQLDLSVVASNAVGAATPVVLTLPVVDGASPSISNLIVAPSTLPAGVKTPLVVTARVTDPCGVRAVGIQIDLGRGFHPAGGLHDNGRGRDVTADDSIFSGMKRLRVKQPGTYQLRVQAKNNRKTTATSAAVAITVN